METAQAKSKLPPRLCKKILQLMESGEHVLGLRLCFHDSLGRSGLPNPMRVHAGPVCMRIRNANKNANQQCVSFDLYKTHRELPGLPEGRIQTCPHGLTELAVPVFLRGGMAGVLFAGPCWNGNGAPPHPELSVAPDIAWLEDRLQMLAAMALKLGELLAGEPFYRPPDRQAQIEEYIQEHLDGEATLPLLAAHLGLSATRASHAVGKLFGKPFSTLLREARMRQAALLLATSALPISDVARMTGITDANYFSRVFRQHYGCPPLAYRKQNRLPIP